MFIFMPQSLKDGPWLLLLTAALPFNSAMLALNANLSLEVRCSGYLA